MATRKVKMSTNLNGEPFANSITSSQNINVNAEVQPPLQLPGIIIFVHGVNSEGEWYEPAERYLCDGLNERLGLNETSDFILQPNLYSQAHWEDEKYIDANSGKEQIRQKWVVPQRRIIEGGEGRSPVIRFYWGYSTGHKNAENKEEYAIPLKNKQGDNYYDLTEDERKTKGPFYWGGGPFQNGCNQLVSLWSDTGFDNWPSILGIPIPFSTQLLNGERDRLLTKAPPRKYYAHAAGRLAKLIKTIRDTHKEDTVTIVSHSQGTMIALAASAIEAPDALFVMNSPYALDNVLLNYITYPQAEIISAEAREQTLANIVNKIAKNKDRLAKQDSRKLLVGATCDRNSWSPTGITVNGFHERDNHGNTYIYCNPHDRVMGSSPLRSIGWQGVPNVNGKAHSLFKNAGDTLFVRMLARNTPCGGKPNPMTPFSHLDSEPFWDSTTTFMQKKTWPDPEPGQTLWVNGPEVPFPIEAKDMSRFDEDYRSRKKQTGEIGFGYGQIDVKKGVPIDADYRYYISLYGYFDRKMQRKPPSGYYQPGPGSKDDRVSYEKQSYEEMIDDVKHYVLRPTDHSTLPQHKEFLKQVVAYDLPIGFCWHSWDKQSLAALRKQADWLESDEYFQTGKMDIPEMPSIILEDIATDQAEKRIEALAQINEINAEANKLRLS
ncbi:T6SS effector phospholipase Tle3 domain-containing protein [Hafnia paralvei]|uniref:T6SS effector phospholipase Tle3 domain-containing protein n=1 Tax=Hafnia paralvei TaxID=546367 RepID=UPI0010346C00|nr:hypothetical protein [Hafnia paralvei]TBM29696.1 hypothetical protein EYY85_05960 [Hafnia paralvei]